VVDADAKTLIARVNKALGENTFILADALQIPRRFTTGCLGLDVILGGGLPGNQWIEVLGKESSGKTSMLLKMIAANQALDKNFTTLWVAGEHFDSDLAGALGVDLSRVILYPHGQEMETAFQVMLEAAESKAVDLTILDSYPALIAEEEDDKAMSEATMAKGAGLMGKFCRKAGKATRRKPDGSERPMVGVIVNQWRDKIGGFSRFGTPQTSPGGNGKNYFFYVRIDVARVEYITEKRPGVKDPVTVGQTVKFKTVKNKSAAPQQTAQVDYYMRRAPFLNFQRGDYDTAKEYFALGKLFRVLGVRGGGYYNFGDQEWRGEENVLKAMRAEPELLKSIGDQVLELASNPKALDELYEDD
jgi:recombination protein RecA